jgi:hypothetical protein
VPRLTLEGKAKGPKIRRSPTHEPPASDHDRFQKARARGEALAPDASALVDARYEGTSDSVLLTFRGGGSMTIPRRMIPGLERQPASALETRTLSPAGDALRWPALDVDVYAPRKHWLLGLDSNQQPSG